MNSVTPSRRLRSGSEAPYAHPRISCQGSAWHVRGDVSAPAHAARDDGFSAADAVAGFLAAAAIFVAAMTVLNIDLTIAGVSLSFRPIKTGTAAEFVALFTTMLGSGRSRLPVFATGFCAVAWFAAMVVAVVVPRPLF